MPPLSAEALITLILGIASLIVALLTFWEARCARREARANPPDAIILEATLVARSSSTQPRLFHHSSSLSISIPSEAAVSQHQQRYHSAAPIPPSHSTPTSLPAAGRPQAALLEAPAAAPTRYQPTSTGLSAAARPSQVAPQAPPPATPAR